MKVAKALARYRAQLITAVKRLITFVPALVFLLDPGTAGRH
jgi:hypothetical protein